MNILKVMKSMDAQHGIEYQFDDNMEFRRALLENNSNAKKNIKIFRI